MWPEYKGNMQYNNVQEYNNYTLQIAFNLNVQVLSFCGLKARQTCLLNHLMQKIFLAVKLSICLKHIFY